ncbi:MAG TPA: hypothetical protein VGD60_16780 [Candidatus Acidoferrales bacterium]
MVEMVESSLDAPALTRCRAIDQKKIEQRRIRNREYMRRRRSDPAFRGNEKRRPPVREKLDPQQIVLSDAATGRQCLPQKCWICRKRAAVEVITRLRPTAKVRSGYVQVRVAYCGFC